MLTCPPEEESELCLPALKGALNFIYLTAPTTQDDRLPKVLKNASGFVYYVSITGVTGAASASVQDIENAVARIRKYTDLPVAVGFGITTPEAARAVAEVADAAVVGSALIKVICENLDKDGKAMDGLVDKALSFAQQLSDGVRQTKV